MPLIFSRSTASRGHWATQAESVLLFALLLMVLMSGMPLYGFAVEGQGSVQLTLQGYGTVQGQLLNTTLQPNGSISMALTVNDKMQTSYGIFPLTASGMWYGVESGPTVSGTIQKVNGQVQICILSCSNANFVGNGRWTGSVINSAANGTFYGTITFTNSPYPQQLPQGQPIPVSGTWNAQLSQESTVPEFTSELTPLAGAVIVTLIVRFRVRRRFDL